MNNLESGLFAIPDEPEGCLFRSLATWGIKKLRASNSNGFKRRCYLTAASLYLGDLIKEKQIRNARLLHEKDPSIFSKYSSRECFILFALTQHLPLIWSSIQASRNYFDDVSSITNFTVSLAWESYRLYEAFWKNEPTVPLSLKALASNLASEDIKRKTKITYSYIPNYYFR